MEITDDLIRKMFPNGGVRLEPFIDHINPALAAGDISNPDRAAAFLAELAHESGEFRYTEEIADGSAYEGREDLGNTQSGDGMRYKGRGPIQITGRANYKACGDALGLDLINHPELLKDPKNGLASAVWFWTKGNSRIDLSLLADKGWFRGITKIVNGAYTGLSDRRMYWDRNRALLGLPMINLDLEEVSIKAFQASKGLVADGQLGPKTFSALKASA